MLSGFTRCWCVFAALLVSVCARSHYIKNVPYHRQITEYACGDASLEMVLEYSGLDVDQKAIIDVARTSAYDGTATYDMVRVGHFSHLSSAAGLNFPENSPRDGFRNRPLGNAAFEYLADEPWLEELKSAIDQDIPVIVLMHYALNDSGGHYRVVVGYDDANNTIFTNDPWNRPPDTREFVGFSYDEFLQLWNYTEVGRAHPHFGVMIMPWKIHHVEVSTTAKKNMWDIHAEFSYPCVPPFPCLTNYLANDAIASIQLPEGFEHGPLSRASVYLGDMQAGATEMYDWQVLNINSTAKNPQAIIQVQAFVHGRVYKCYCDTCAGNYYPPYDYVDVIGAQLQVDLPPNVGA